MAGLVLVTPPTVEPVPLDDIKLFVRQDGTTAEDTLFDELLRAARRRLEERAEIAFITQTWDLFLDAFPTEGELAIELPRSPLLSVATVKYTDANAVETTMPSTDYYVDTAARPGRVLPVVGTHWPTATLRVANGVAIRFVAGFGPTEVDVPEPQRQAIKELVGHWYQRRDMIEVPTAVDAMLRDFYVRDYA